MFVPSCEMNSDLPTVERSHYLTRKPGCVWQQGSGSDDDSLASYMLQVLTPQIQTALTKAVLTRMICLNPLCSSSPDLCSYIAAIMLHGFSWRPWKA